ncbi:hypothetical protein [Methylomonas methanica]|uniref:hypothetical protein n=1 Tax=Methylomonas methanica TaxID=421 RepID=UPI0011D26C19|nr:hypothetical protein [Methylomonas methanica]
MLFKIIVYYPGSCSPRQLLRGGSFCFFKSSALSYAWRWSKDNPGGYFYLKSVDPRFPSLSGWSLFFI